MLSITIGCTRSWQKAATPGEPHVRPEDMKPDLTEYSNLGLFELYADIISELRRRDIVHSSTTL